MNFTELPDAKVFGDAGEQPGSQAAYEREIEIKRRLYLLEKDLLAAQIEGVAAQRAATAEAAQQSRLMFYSTIGIFAAALITLATAFI